MLWYALSERQNIKFLIPNVDLLYWFQDPSTLPFSVSFSFGFILVEKDEAYVFATRKEIRVPFGYLKSPHSGDMPSQRYF